MSKHHLKGLRTTARNSRYLNEYPEQNSNLQSGWVTQGWLISSEYPHMELKPRVCSRHAVYSMRHWIGRMTKQTQVELVLHPAWRWHDCFETCCSLSFLIITTPYQLHKENVREIWNGKNVEKKTLVVCFEDAILQFPSRVEGNHRKP